MRQPSNTRNVTQQVNKVKYSDKVVLPKAVETDSR